MMPAQVNETRIPRWERLTPRARALTIAAAAVVIVGTVVTGLLLLRTDGAARSGGGRAAASMKGMPGMDAGAGGAVVRLTSAQLRQFGVTFATVEVRQLASETRTTGMVTVDETKLAQVTPKFSGFVDRLYVNATGQPVRRGEPLLDVYSPDLLAAQQDLLVAAQLERDIGRSAVPGVPGNTTDLVAAARRRLELWDISDAQIDEILRSGHARRALTLYAPATGVVLEKRVVQGQSIQPGEPLYTIADLSDVWVDVQLREADAAAAKAGAGADIELAGVPGRVFKGRVTYVYPTLDSASRAVRARVVVANTTGLLKPGMYATVRLFTPSRSALTVPNTAVLRTGEQNVVFVDMGNGQLAPNPVELGRTAGDYTEVLSGLEPGQGVVTSAQFLLDSESNLAEVMRAMMSQMSAADVNQMKDMPGMQMPGTNDRGADMKGMPGMKAPAAPTPRR